MKTFCVNPVSARRKYTSLRLDISFTKGAFNSTKIPGMLCDEWNSIFRFVELTNPRSSRFQVSRENTRSNGGLFYLCLLALGLFDDSEVEMNDVLGEGDNITFIVRI